MSKLDESKDANVNSCLIAIKDPSESDKSNVNLYQAEDDISNTISFQVAESINSAKDDDSEDDEIDMGRPQK